MCLLSGETICGNDLLGVDRCSRPDRIGEKVRGGICAGFLDDSAVTGTSNEIVRELSPNQGEILGHL